MIRLEMKDFTGKLPQQEDKAIFADTPIISVELYLLLPKCKRETI